MHIILNSIGRNARSSEQATLIKDLSFFFLFVMLCLITN